MLLRGGLLALALVLLVPGNAAAAGAARASLVGGDLADPAAWPFMAAVVDRGVEDTFQAQFCGGALVSSQAVLTAAHCVSGKAAAEIEVVFGARLSPGQPRSGVERVVRHPGYREDRLGDHDLAVLRLSAPVPSAPVGLAAPAQDGQGQAAAVAGYGNQVGAGEHGYPADLLDGDVAIGGGLCRDAAWDARRVLCADSDLDVVSACDGDSGGPLVSRGRLVGIVSYGPEDCRTESYFVRVSAERGFIDAAVAGRPVPAWRSPGVAPLSLAQARVLLPRILEARFRSGFSSRWRYRLGCYRLTSQEVRCRVRWRARASRYQGWVDMRNDPRAPATSSRYRMSVTRTPR